MADLRRDIANDLRDVVRAVERHIERNHYGCDYAEDVLRRAKRLELNVEWLFRKERL
jgi:hypothetical protein